MELFGKIGNGLTIFPKTYNLDVWQGFEYAFKVQVLKVNNKNTKLMFWMCSKSTVETLAAYH